MYMLQVVWSNRSNSKMKICCVSKAKHQLNKIIPAYPTRKRAEISKVT